MIDSGSVLVKNGKVEQVYTGAAPDAGELKADVVEAAGKTLLPGLIDTARASGLAGRYVTIPRPTTPIQMRRLEELAAYLYSGVTAVRSVGDLLDRSLEARIADCERRRGWVRSCLSAAHMFTAENGHGTEYIQYMPEFLREHAREQMVRTPKTADEARQQVRALKQAGADCVKAILEAGWPGHPFPRLDTALLKAIGEEARAQNLPLAVHTGNARDVADALDAGAASIEHGSFSDEIPDALFARMVKDGVSVRSDVERDQRVHSADRQRKAADA